MSTNNETPSVLCHDECIMKSWKAPPTVFNPQKAIGSSQNTTPSQTTADFFNFLALPGELRNLIYDFYCVDYYNHNRQESDTIKNFDTSWTLRTIAHDPLIQVSRQIRAECMGAMTESTNFLIIHNHTFTFLGTYGLQHSTSVRIVPFSWCEGAKLWDRYPPQPTPGGLIVQPLLIRKEDEDHFVMVCQTLAKCPNLKHLAATFKWTDEGPVSEDTSISLERGVERVMKLPVIQALMRIRGLQSIQLDFTLMVVVPVTGSSVLAERLTKVSEKVKQLVITNGMSTDDASMGLLMEEYCGEGGIDYQIG